MAFGTHINGWIPTEDAESAEKEGKNMSRRDRWIEKDTCNILILESELERMS